MSSAWAVPSAAAKHATSAMRCHHSANASSVRILSCLATEGSTSRASLHAGLQGAEVGRRVDVGERIAREAHRPHGPTWPRRRARCGSPVVPASPAGLAAAWVGHSATRWCRLPPLSATAGSGPRVAPSPRGISGVSPGTVSSAVAPRACAHSSPPPPPPGQHAAERTLAGDGVGQHGLADRQARRVTVRADRQMRVIRRQGVDDAVEQGPAGQREERLVAAAHPGGVAACEDEGGCLVPGPHPCPCPLPGGE